MPSTAATQEARVLRLAKARKLLGWEPKVRFKQLIEMMVRADEEDVRSALAGRAPTS